MSVQVHASCVAIAGAGVLLTGAPGAGKSTAALRLIALGAELVSDDQVILSREGERLLAGAPPAIAGRIEARGFGILALPHVDGVPLAVVVDLDTIETRRLPPGREAEIEGVRLPLVLGRDLPDLAAALFAWLGRGGRREEA